MIKPNSFLPDTQISDPEEQFQLLDMLGQGAYGSVYKAIHKKSGCLYAIKILSATSMSEIAAIKKQIQILKLCDNEHIVKYYGSYFKDNSLWIVLEYCHAGSIIDLLNITQRKLNQNQIASILESVLEGLVYLHENKKIHRDIKAANILLNKEGVAKLADFGVSAQSMYTNAGHKSQVGSPYWMSPEVMKHNEYTNKTDIWSLGVTSIELAEGVVPNSHLKPLIAMWQLKDKPIQQFKQPQRWSAEFNNFVKDCLNVSPVLRPEAKSLLRHDFIVNKSKGQKILTELIEKSLADIEQFRLGQDKSSDSQKELIDMLNSSEINQGIQAILKRNSQGSQSQAQKHGFSFHQSNPAQSSMIINQDENNGSVIINNNESSMIVTDQNQKSATFLNQYISGLKSTQNEAEKHKDALRKKIMDYDQICHNQIQASFSKYKQTIDRILVEGINDHFFGMDQAFIKKEFNSQLLNALNIQDFVLIFAAYKRKQIKEEPKALQHTEKEKKKSECPSMAHTSTQTEDPFDHSSLSQSKQANPRNVKSQQFSQKPFKMNEKHYFNSNSIISDIQNVNYKNEGQDRPVWKRFIATEPQEWLPDRLPFQFDSHLTQAQHKAKLKEQFFLDPDVKESLIAHMQQAHNYQDNDAEPNTVKYDRSTLNIPNERRGFTHQNSLTVIRSSNIDGHLYSQSDHVVNQQFDGSTEVNINLFNTQPVYKPKKLQIPKKQKKMQKRKQNSRQKRNTQQKKNYCSTGSTKNKLKYAK